MNKICSAVTVAIAALCVNGYSDGVAKGAGGTFGVATATVESASETAQVKGKGVGATQEAALKDAYRDAVESAVGLYVDAEQMMKNDEIIKDQILTQSNAYIERYEIKSRKERDGLVEIVIWAQVRKQELAKKIKAVMPSQNVQVGNTLANIHAVNETIEKRSSDGFALLQNALNEFHPTSSLVDFTLMSSEPAVIQPAQTFRKRQGGSDNIAYPFLTKINMERYQQVVVERLKPVLSQISVVQPRRTGLPIVMEGRPDANVMRERLLSGKKWRKGEGPNMCIISAPKASRHAEAALRLEAPYNCLLVTGINPAGTIAEVEMYQLDEAACEAFQKWMRAEQGPEYRVIFKDGNGSALYQEAMKPAFCQCYELQRGRFGCVKFAPWCIRRYNGDIFCAGEWRNVNIPREVQPNVRSITVEQIQ